MKVIVGAYAASPCHSAWNPEAEGAYFKGLAALPEIGALELPFFGSLHRYDDDWFLANVPRHWDYLMTCIPGVMITAGQMPEFGLASTSESGRRAAIEFTDKARQAVLRLNRHLGRKAVLGVEIHSAPPLNEKIAASVGSNREKFLESLSEVRSWDWDGARLTIEHCDRYASGGLAPAKGFLSIEDEIWAATQSCGETPIGILVNWGRSAIEGRSAETPVTHLLQAKKAGLVDGVIFSGASQGDALYGDWADSHAPFGKGAVGRSECVTSLMTPKSVRLSLDAAGPDAHFSGFKIQALPKDLSAAQRIEFVRDCLSTYVKTREGVLQ